LAKRAKVKPIHYVDNEKFLKEMIIYKAGFDEAKAKDELPPMISEYIGECFMKIAQRLSFRPNFINYAFKDDMISDGIENCIQYIKNFNPEKSSNPFAYFTQIIYYAFIRRIQKEKTQLYIKYKTMQSAPSLLENVEVSANDSDKGYNQETMNNDQKANMYNFIQNFEDAKAAKSVAKKPVKTTNLEYFMVS
jgi:DNA-directed RNA polymerase specialized sigma subunit